MKKLEVQTETAAITLMKKKIMLKTLYNRLEVLRFVMLAGCHNIDAHKVSTDFDTVSKQADKLDDEIVLLQEGMYYVQNILAH